MKLPQFRMLGPESINPRPGLGLFSDFARLLRALPLMTCTSQSPPQDSGSQAAALANLDELEESLGDRETATVASSKVLGSTRPSSSERRTLFKADKTLRSTLGNFKTFSRSIGLATQMATIRNNSPRKLPVVVGTAGKPAFGQRPGPGRQRRAGKPHVVADGEHRHGLTIHIGPGERRHLEDVCGLGQ
jgi:hypothetical protein